MSKSGLFAHFGSKEELQLATIETARGLFNELVIEPASHAPTAYGRLELLIEKFLQHVEDKVYPGGCFFVSVARGARRRKAAGCVTRRSGMSGEWMQLVVGTIREAQAEGDIDCCGGRRAACVRADRLSAARQHAVRRHAKAGSARPGASCGGTAAHTGHRAVSVSRRSR